MATTAGSSCHGVRSCTALREHVHIDVLMVETRVLKGKEEVAGVMIQHFFLHTVPPPPGPIPYASPAPAVAVWGEKNGAEEALEIYNFLISKRPDSRFTAAEAA